MKWLTLAALLAATTARAEDYVVEDGDSCLAIAVRVLGDRTQLDALHRLNPQLGTLPHRLVAGTVIHLPPHAPTGPDAKLTRAAGDVKIRKPSTSEWNAAQRGMDLFRAWRIGAADRANAELTFRDDSRLGMRERTIVVIYGPEKRLAKVITATASLEEGTLEARLGELDGKPVVVRTPAGSTDLRAGTALVSSQPGGASIVANHGGAPIPLRGTTRARAVKIAAGMGSRVLPGKAPEKPRPLPPSPVWPARTAWVALGTTTPVALEWHSALRATSYRVAIVDVGGDTVAVATVAAPAHGATIELAPGRYTAIASAIDADGFESVPAPRDIEVIDGELVHPGSTVVAGAELVAPQGWTCRAGGDPAATRVVLRSAGPTTIFCGDGIRTATPFIIDVMRADPPRLVRAAPFPARARDVTFGAFASYFGAADRTERGLGLRVGWRHRALGAELSLGYGLASEGDRTAHAASARLEGVLRTRGRAWVGVVIGGGVSSLVESADLPLDTGASLTGGAALSLPVGDFDLRLDLRGVAYPDDAWRYGSELQLGIELRL